MIKTSMAKILRTFLLILVLIFQNPIFSFSQYNSFILSNKIVEVFGAPDLRIQNMPIKRLEKNLKSKVNGICFLIEEIPEKGLYIPNEYGMKRWDYLRQKFFNTTYYYKGLPLTIINDQLYYFGRGVGHTVEEKNESWLEEISSLISESKSKLHIAEERALIQRYQDDYQVTFNIKWQTLPDKETFSRYRYLLFLVADEIETEYMGGQIFENVAYDFIPLEGDDPKAFDGSGLPLVSLNRKISPEDEMITLSTATFKLPEMKRDTGWSLHLILEDPENLGKAIFSYRIRLL